MRACRANRYKQPRPKSAGRQIWCLRSRIANAISEIGRPNRPPWGSAAAIRLGAALKRRRVGLLFLLGLSVRFRPAKIMCPRFSFSQTALGQSLSRKFEPRPGAERAKAIVGRPPFPIVKRDRHGAFRVGQFHPLLPDRGRYTTGTTWDTGREQPSGCFPMESARRLRQDARRHREK